MLYKTKTSSILIYLSPDYFIDHNSNIKHNNFSPRYEILNFESNENIAILVDSLELNFFDGEKFHKSINLKKILINNKTGWLSDPMIENQLEKL